jgi:hypothetical protein
MKSTSLALGLVLFGLSAGFAATGGSVDAAAGTTTIAQDEPVERRTHQVKGTGYTTAEAVAEARSLAQFWIQLEGARSYRVLGQSIQRIGDVYVCTLNIEYYVRGY